MQIFLINLERKPDRHARMANLLTQMNLGYERIIAVDGKNLDENDVAAWSQQKSDGSFHLSASEVGCYLSHREAWSQIAEMPSSYGLVLEDDLHFASRSAELLANDDWIPAGSDIVKIETVFWRTLIDRKSSAVGHGYRLSRLYGQHFGMAGYILSPTCARRLLQLQSIDRAIDQILFDPAADLFKSLTIHQLVPAICVQDQFLDQASMGIGTDIERGWKLSRKRKSLGQKIAREARRLSAQMHDLLIGKLLSVVTGIRLTKIPFEK